MKKILLVILFYYKKFLSPLLVAAFGTSCRYKPTCGEFAYQAIEKYGIIRGFKLAILRIISCNYLSRKDFYDPLPIK